MNERELARAMNVCRTTIRDAIQRLVAMGMIVQKQAQGTFVILPWRNTLVLCWNISKKEINKPDQV